MRLFGERRTRLNLEDIARRERQKETLAPTLAFSALQNSGVKQIGEWPEARAEAKEITPPEADAMETIKIDSRL